MSTEQVAYGDAGPGSRTIPWDELRPGGAGGPVASHWERVWTPLEALGPEGLAIRAASLERLLRDEGVTYTAAWTPGTDTGRRRAWDLDPVPVVVDSDDWRAIEAGLVQRAELLDLVLTDLNGPRDLIRRGLIPAALLWANPAFLPPCTDVAVPGSQQLILVATDLARGPDGQMLVLADRAQMPSGVGYAIMNRLVMSRAFPSLYRDAQVHRLSAFLRRLRAALGALAPGRDDDPGVVILTPGPASPTYFEHAFLASQLGYPLVSGGDLEVHQGHVTIRSVAGRGRVDVIVRRVDADDLDPLELRPDSLLGVPGLLEAARSGRVSIVNPPGTGVLEHPALPAFLPGLARHFLGHDLLLASPALWWCGRHGDRAYVLDHLEELVLRRCGPTSQGGRSVHGAGLTGAQRDELARRIGAAPHQWVGREYVEPSVVPTLVAGTRLEARPVTVRAFLVAHGGSYLTMPGGLVKVAPSDGTADGRLFADSPGAGSGAPAQAVPPGLARGRVQRPSKDAWVLSTEPEQPGGPLDVPLAASAPVALPGRAAEHMFVIGRSAERAEVTVRVLGTVLSRLDQPLDEHGAEQVLNGLLDALWALTAGGPGPAGPASGRALAAILDPARPASLVATLRTLVDAAFAVQEQLSGDTWQVLADVESSLAALESQPPELLLAVQPDLAGLTRALLALAGLAVESMVRDAAWCFLDGGRRVERALALATVLRVTLVPVRPPHVEALLGESVLRAFESIIDYRRRFHATAQARLIAEQLVFDAENPRSLRWQLDRLADDLAALPRRDGRRLNPEERPVLDARTTVSLVDPASLFGPDDGPAERRGALDGFLARLAGLLEEATSELDRAYFVAPSRAALAQTSNTGRSPA